LRASEVGLSRTSDRDFKKLRIMLHRLKGSYSGEHPLQPDEAKAIKADLRERDHESPILFTSSRGDPISRRTLDWLMKAYGAEAKIPPETCSMSARTSGSSEISSSAAIFRTPSSIRS